MAAGIVLSKCVMYGPGKMELHLDRRKVVLDDPGADTPAMVHVGVHSGTFWCAADTGELDAGEYQLTEQQCRWLQQKVDEVNVFLYGEEE